MQSKWTSPSPLSGKVKPPSRWHRAHGTAFGTLALPRPQRLSGARCDGPLRLSGRACRLVLGGKRSALYVRDTAIPLDQAVHTFRTRAQTTLAPPPCRTPPGQSSPAATHAAFELSKNKAGNEFVGFLPAVSDDARKRIGREIRRWRLHVRSGTTLTELARSINVIVRGWINYYGRFYRSMLARLLRRINDYLVRWATRKYKRLRRRPAPGTQAARRGLPTRAQPVRPRRIGARPDGWTMGAG